MLWFNRFFWPALVLVGVLVQVQLYRAGSLPGVGIVFLIQLGIGVFIWHDWKKRGP